MLKRHCQAERRVGGWVCHHQLALSKTLALRLILGHCTARATSAFPKSILRSVPSIDTDGALSRSFSMPIRERYVLLKHRQRTNDHYESFLGAFFLRAFWISHNTTLIWIISCCGTWIVRATAHRLQHDYVTDQQPGRLLATAKCTSLTRPLDWGDIEIFAIRHRSE